MYINNLSISFLAIAASQISNFASAKTNSEETKSAIFQSSMAMRGSANLRSDPVFIDAATTYLSEWGPLVDEGKQNLPERRYLRPSGGSSSDSSKDVCDPSEINLREFPQWEGERGYWIGTFTFLGADGQPFESSSWNYPYNDYKGFITGEVVGNAYRQRNVFLYPPQNPEKCAVTGDATIGNGVCGVNGNTKIFSADQNVTVCTPESEEGSIEGLYAGFFPTKTTLIGNDNALLYQVFTADGSLFQSQLTTLTENPITGDAYRTRSAQGFSFTGESSYCSYYRERKVNATEFWDEFKSAAEAYNILEEDLCKWDGGGFEVTATGSVVACETHLNQTFALATPVSLAPPCVDDPDFYIGKKTHQNCEFISNSEKRIENACKREEVAIACPVTCGTCSRYD